MVTRGRAGNEVRAGHGGLKGSGGVWKRGWERTAAVGLLKGGEPENRFTGNCIWGVGKRWGVLRLFTPRSDPEVIRRVGKSSRTDD